MRTLRTLLFGVLAIAALSGFVVAQSHYTFTPIASASDYAGYFEPGTVTNFDDVLFGPAMPSGGEGVLLWQHGQITPIALGGMPTFDAGVCWPPTDPSDCPVFGYTFSPVQMNERGDAVFNMTRDGINNVPTPYGINVGVYRYNRRTGVVPVMVPGMPAPGGGRFWGSYFVLSIGQDGDIYFTGMVCTTATVSFPTQACRRARCPYLWRVQSRLTRNNSLGGETGRCCAWWKLFRLRPDCARQREWRRGVYRPHLLRSMHTPRRSVLRSQHVPENSFGQDHSACQGWGSFARAWEEIHRCRNSHA